jgi:ribulose-phosphate 3-epimerase
VEASKPAKFESSGRESVFRLSSPKLRIAPSLLSADFGRLREQLAPLEEAGCEVLHLDVMDGHFVPNISFGVPVIQSLRRHTNLFLDTHLMISEPARYAEAFARAGCDLLTFHIETTDDPASVVETIRRQGVAAGVALNPTTTESRIESILENVDLVLVMSVWPGFGGQSFIADVLPKVEAIRRRLRPDQRMEIDGGIDATTVARAASAGADTLVAGSAIFGRPDPIAAYRLLEQSASGSGAR